MRSMENKCVQVFRAVDVRIYYFIFMITGWGLGTLSFGPLIDAIGTRWSFRVAAAISLTTCILYMICQQFLPPVKLLSRDMEDGRNNKTSDNSAPDKVLDVVIGETELGDHLKSEDGELNTSALLHKETHEGNRSE